MKRIFDFGFILTVLIYFGYPAWSQDSKYREIYPYIESHNLVEAVPRLKEYLKNDPEHPSANLQLALIFEERFKSYHPILQYHPAIKNANNAKTYFLKANYLIDEKEIKKNGKRYYTNFARIDLNGKLEVEYMYVKSRMDSAYLEIDRFLRNAPGIYDHFTNSVRCYGTSVRLFGEVNEKFGTLKDLYMMYDQVLDKKLNEISVNYDSSLYYFNKYLEATAIYPITSYQQSFQINPIYHYRLDGLETQTDFLARQVILWDYSKWVNEVKSMVKGEIAEIKEQVLTTEERLTQSIRVLSKPSVAIHSAPDVKPVDRELILKLKNYDHGSVILPMLLYKERKQDLLFRGLREFKWDSDSVSSESYENLLTFYSQMFLSSREADSLLQIAVRNNNEENMIKYYDLISKYYVGREGFTRYLSNESTDIQALRIRYASRLQETILTTQNEFTDSTLFADYKKTHIPLFIHLPDTSNMEFETHYTHLITQNPDSSYYVSGILKQKKTGPAIHSYIAKVSSDRKVVWYKDYQYASPDSSSTLSFSKTSVLLPVPEGLMAIIHIKSLDGGMAVNQARLIDDNGSDLLVQYLSCVDYPRKILYNEKNGSFLMVFHGLDNIDFPESDENVTWLKFNRDGTEEWVNNYNFTGNVTDVVSISNGHILFGNFSKIINMKGETIRLSSEAGEIRAYALKIDDTGNKTDLQIFDLPVSYILKVVRKISDNSINLLGFKGLSSDLNQSLDIHQDEMIHLITNSGLKILHKNL